MYLSGLLNRRPGAARIQLPRLLSIDVEKVSD